MKNFAKRVSALVLALVVGAAALCPAAFAAAVTSPKTDTVSPSFAGVPVRSTMV